MGSSRVRTIQVVTVGRSDFGIYRPLLKRIASEPSLHCELLVGGAHLAPQHGSTVKLVEESGFPIAGRIDMQLTSDTPAGIARSMGVGTAGFADIWSGSVPDLLIVLGDRFEMHAAVVAAQPFLIPIAHIAGGFVTMGAIDDAFRHSMTKMSHLHFVETEAYGRRVVQMGEDPARVTVSGALAIDNLQDMQILSPSGFESRYGLSLTPKPLAVTFHPVTREYERTEEYCGELLGAIEASGLPAIFTLPNADTHGSLIARRIEAFVAGSSRFHLVPNFGTEGYFSLMTHACAMVGNSSSGLVEAASFGLPVVNVGNRQQGRMAPANVIHTRCDREDILKGIREAVSDAFRTSIAGLVNPYGTGNASGRIVDVLKAVPLDGLVAKRFYE
jgi:UDP-hydrolysing UDP-N-acetyl-D-glucosamine 2-epimerase